MSKKEQFDETKLELYKEVLKFIKPLEEEEYKWAWFMGENHLSPKVGERQYHYGTFERPILAFIRSIEKLQSFEESKNLLIGREKELSNLTLSKIKLKKFSVDELIAIINLTIETEIPNKGTIKFNCMSGAYLKILKHIQKQIL